MREPLANLNPLKFKDPKRTLKGESRAFVPFQSFETLWFNTGTLCNLSCSNCYIESSPKNDALVFLTHADLVHYLNELKELVERPCEIGFTGGEPFVNPQMNELMETCLESGYRVLLLTNAMRPMQRPAVAERLRTLNQRYGDRLSMRVSLDHYTSNLHEKERGLGSWRPAIAGISWLVKHSFSVTIAGRTCWGESVVDAREGYHELFRKYRWPINAHAPNELILFPEMGTGTDVPEITTECWSILNQSPSQLMCASSRMVVKRKGQPSPTVVACTLLPYTDEFDYGSSLKLSMVDTYLNHPHCARFCVLGGASCSA